MSDGHDHEHDDAADAHDDHGFDGEPATALSPGETPTPGWLPAIGAALFVAAAVFFLVQGDDAPEAKPTPAPQVVATAAPPRAMPAPARPGSPAGAGTPSVRKLDPSQMKDVQQRIDEARKKLDGQAAPAPAPNGAK